MMEIEQSLASNICRCTGYRPILEAFKTFASDAPEPNNLQDIEDLKICKKNGKTCDNIKCATEWCVVEEKDVKAPQNIEIELKDGKTWFKVQSISDVFNILKKKGDDSYMFVAGNTAKGISIIFNRFIIIIKNMTKTCHSISLLYSQRG